jgi:hypothetical protein
MRAIDVAGFERKFRENIDPWDYTNSGFEHFKRTVLLRACGHGKHGLVRWSWDAQLVRQRAILRPYAYGWWRSMAPQQP